ncbi:MAG: hypothetical protein IBJ05_01770 [Blastomonas sp.]|nr:hypothetical protein [Blastomonas sp.]
MNKRNTILALLGFLILLLVFIETGLAADDRVFFGLIGLFVLSQIVWVSYYLRNGRKKDLERNLDRMFSDD